MKISRDLLEKDEFSLIRAAGELSLCSLLHVFMLFSGNITYI